MILWAHSFNIESLNIVEHVHMTKFNNVININTYVQCATDQQSYYE